MTDLSFFSPDFDSENFKQTILKQLDNLIGVEVRLTKSAQTLAMLPKTDELNSILQTVLKERVAIQERLREVDRLLRKPCGDVWCPAQYVKK